LEIRLNPPVAEFEVPWIAHMDWLLMAGLEAFLAFTKQ
jgi:hypothetical protein